MVIAIVLTPAYLNENVSRHKSEYRLKEALASLGNNRGPYDLRNTSMYESPRLEDKLGLNAPILIIIM